MQSAEISKYEKRKYSPTPRVEKNTTQRLSQSATTVMLILLKCQPTSAVEKLEVYVSSHHVGPVVGSSDQETPCQGMGNRHGDKRGFTRTIQYSPLSTTANCIMYVNYLYH